MPKDPYAADYGVDTEYIDGTKSYALGDGPDDLATGVRVVSSKPAPLDLV